MYWNSATFERMLKAVVAHSSGTGLYCIGPNDVVAAAIFIVWDNHYCYLAYSTRNRAAASERIDASTNLGSFADRWPIRNWIRLRRPQQWRPVRRSTRATLVGKEDSKLYKRIGGRGAWRKLV